MTATLLRDTAAALTAVDDYVARARTALVARFGDDGTISAKTIDANQFTIHGFAWVATYAEALRQLHNWAAALPTVNDTDALLLEIGFGEYLNQFVHGVMMSQNEVIRPHQLGLTDDDLARFKTDEVSRLIAAGTDPDKVISLSSSLEHHRFGSLALDDTMGMVQDQFRRFADDKVAPFAHGWHLRDELIPMSVVDDMCTLGVFGLTIPEQFGGAGLGKMAMCVVSEELSRGYIGVGSLGTRSEIAAELILGGGTDAQKAHYLPKIASGEILPTAVFTEPDIGSDLAHLKTRATKTATGWSVTGNKTWITHAARANMMTMLVRTNPDETGYKGLSMLLGEKPRGTPGNDFPADGMEGGEIGVIGYRGMKEYDLRFDGFAVPDSGLLGGEEGQGFKQLMRTFESARIQTAARAVGVAQAAMENGLGYALDRKQFGKAIFGFPRVAHKLCMMAVETMIARQLTYFAARAKDEGKRCDLEAGMAKLLGARIAWANADNALQIHGGNGFSMEFAASRLLADARILNIFEGAAEIQAQVIARRVLEGNN